MILQKRFSGFKGGNQQVFPLKQAMQTALVNPGDLGSHLVLP